MERIAPAGDVYQAGTLSGNPLAVAAGRAALRMLDDAAYARLAATTERARRRPARGRRRPPRAGRRRRTGLLTVFFSDEPVRDYAGAAACDLEALRRLVPGAARARRLPAAVAVRGLVPVARPQARARRRARSRRRRRRSRRSRDAAARARSRRRPRRAAGCSPTPCATAARRRAAGAAAAPGRARRRTATLRLLVEAIREGYLLHYGEGRVLRPDDPDLALLAGDRLYALGLARLAELGDLEAVAALADVISRARAGARRGRPGDVGRRPRGDGAARAARPGPRARRPRRAQLASAPSAPALRR